MNVPSMDNDSADEPSRKILLFFIRVLLKCSILYDLLYFLSFHTNWSHFSALTSSPNLTTVAPDFGVSHSSLDYKINCVGIRSCVTLDSMLVSFK